jgi:hypothetical protein
MLTNFKRKKVMNVKNLPLIIYASAADPLQVADRAAFPQL